MTIIINGDTKEVPAGLTLEDMLKFFSLPSQRVAVELNKAVISRGYWKTTEVSEKDRIEIIHFVGGG